MQPPQLEYVPFSSLHSYTPHLKRKNIIGGSFDLIYHKFMNVFALYTARSPLSYLTLTNDFRTNGEPSIHTISIVHNALLRECTYIMYKKHTHIVTGISDHMFKSMCTIMIQLQLNLVFAMQQRTHDYVDLA